MCSTPSATSSCADAPRCCTGRSAWRARSPSWCTASSRTARQRNRAVSAPPAMARGRRPAMSVARRTPGIFNPRRTTCRFRVRASPRIPERPSTPPAQYPRLDRVDEVAAFDARPRVFLLQPVIPFRLAVGIVDEEEGRRMAQAALLQGDDVAILVEELAHEEAQQRA